MRARHIEEYVKKVKESYLNALSNIYNGSFDEHHDYEEDYDLLKFLIDDYFRLEAENIGLRQTIENFKEKQEKFFRNV